MAMDQEFYKRADEHIHLSNQQIKDDVSFGEVSASTLFATARFNAWVSACGWNTKDELEKARQDTIEYFVSEYRKMLEENVDDYIKNFDSYMEPAK